MESEKVVSQGRGGHWRSVPRSLSHAVEVVSEASFHGCSVHVRTAPALCAFQCGSSAAISAHLNSADSAGTADGAREFSTLRLT